MGRMWPVGVLYLVMHRTIALMGYIGILTLTLVYLSISPVFC